MIFLPLPSSIELVDGKYGKTDKLIKFNGFPVTFFEWLCLSFLLLNNELVNIGRVSCEAKITALCRGIFEGGITEENCIRAVIPIKESKLYPKYTKVRLGSGTVTTLDHLLSYTKLLEDIILQSK